MKARAAVAKSGLANTPTRMRTPSTRAKRRTMPPRATPSAAPKGTAAARRQASASSAQEPRQRPAPRAAAHTGRPSSPATTALATVAATRVRGAMACLWMGSLLLARSFRLQIDRVQRQGEPGEHTDHREQRKGVHEPVDAGSDAKAGDDAAQQQEGDRLGRSGRAFLVVVPPVI